MHKYFIAACVVLGAASPARAQSAAAPTSAAAAPASARSIFQPPMTLASCTPVSDDTNRFTLTNPKSTPSWYRSAGTRLLQTGQRVQIVGRLLPTPNIAAQAGSLDPWIPAVAFASRESRIVAVPMPRASTFRLVPESAATTAECVTR
jgi:hypothetical protein